MVFKDEGSRVAGTANRMKFGILHSVSFPLLLAHGASIRRLSRPTMRCRMSPRLNDQYHLRNHGREGRTGVPSWTVKWKQERKSLLHTRPLASMMCSSHGDLEVLLALLMSVLHPKS